MGDMIQFNDDLNLDGDPRAQGNPSQADVEETAQTESNHDPDVSGLTTINSEISELSELFHQSQRVEHGRQDTGDEGH